MNVSEPFIRRPVGTSLLAVAVLIAGFIAYFLLPVSPLPEVEFPTISVQAGLPGASPETMASAVATPLERQFGRIAGITEMTSTSQLGSTQITMQFDLSRNIDAAARDVQAAINAARGKLPANLPNSPTYRKTNPADAPIILLALTSDTMPLGRMYDAADSILAQKIAQVEGVGQVIVGGGAKPAVRVQVNPTQLSAYGIGTDEVRNALNRANANSPKGEFSGAHDSLAITADDQLKVADQYKPLVVTYRNGAPVRLDQVANVFDSVENTLNAALFNSKPAVLMIIFRQPGANIIGTVDRIRELLPLFQASIPGAMKLSVVNDRTTTIRTSVQDVEVTLTLAVALVVMVIFLFLRNAAATFIPSVAVPLSLLGTVALMYLLHYSIDNLSLMALTVATGFVVDDAIVVIENITRYIEAGDPPVRAAFKGAREIGFTVLSMSTSLVAVFIPILLMGGIVGRLFREFAVVLSMAVAVSLLVSLTTTPMLCAKFLRPESERKHGRLYRLSERAFNGMHNGYAGGLRWVLRHSALMLVVMLATMALAVYLYIIVPKGFFPQQDTGRLMGSIQASQDISFVSLRQKQQQFSDIVLSDPAVDTVGAFTGGGARNTARFFIQLKPLNQRKASADQVIARLRGKLSHIPGANLFLQPVQDVRVGGRMSNAQFQYTLQDANLAELNEWAPRLMQRLKVMKELRDVSSDQQNKGLELRLVIDRDTAGRLGVQPQQVDEALYDAFGQRQVSTIYRQLNQYHVVMEVAPQFQQNPDALKQVYVHAVNGKLVPLSAFTHYEPSNTALAVNHQSQFPATTISFNLAPGVSLGEAVRAIDDAERRMMFPGNILASFSGTAAAFQESLKNQPILILAALVTVYIVLGVLYESYMHPITILSTLPSAGVGALLALLISKTDLTVMALIGIILLIGIVKKNAIMMIDFALDAERRGHMEPDKAIYEASLLRFRPIMMTTLAAMFGALPLALGGGVGAELRRPLGLTIVGGLIVSQALTLFTTPVMYLYLDRLRWKLIRLRGKAGPELGGGAGLEPHAP
ncbi:MAG: multidrug efflux RND transporter permease subunit [Acidobacteriia bacterium]|nr:multidrug efflux RND transporter permease subunit [Terriglobia bacterium]